MLWIPTKGVLRQQSNLQDLGTQSQGTNVQSGSSAGAKTATPVQLLGSLNFDCYLLMVATYGHGNTAALNGALLDIMVGSAGNEDVLIPDILCGHTDGTITFSTSWWFPVYIPAGTRISARTESERASAANRVAVIAYGGHGTPPFRVASRVTAYGIDGGANASGTDVVCTTGGTWGDWTEITSGTSEYHFGFVPSVQLNNGDTAILATSGVLEFGFGASTAEDLFEGSRVVICSNTAEYADRCPMFPTYADIPSGTRLVARHGNMSNNITRQAAMYGLS